MSWLSSLLGIGEKAVDVADQAVLDKDRLVQLAKEGRTEELTAYAAELATKTVPWVDALHKMGRQIQVYILLGMGFYSMHTGRQLDEMAWGVLGGATGIYAIMKGRGK